MKTIILNASNYVAGSNNQFIYQFPSTVQFSKDDQIALGSCAIYNSTFNISAALGNNSMTITWNANTVTTYNLLFPDGFYSYSDINQFIQFYCISNNLYATSTTSGINIYFLELVTNSVRYAAQLNSYSLPTTAQAVTLGYTLPVGATWTFPVTASTPQLTFGNVFGSLIGLLPGIYPPTVITTNYNIVSTYTPEVSIVQSYIMTCNLIRCPLSNPNNVFYSIPLTVGFGSLVTLQPSQLIFNDIDPSYYGNIVISFFDQNFNKLTLNDPVVVITLVISNKKNDK